MSARLETVQEAAELRRDAETEFRRALVNAAERDPHTGKPYHTLSEIGRAAGLTKPGCAYLIRRTREENAR